MKESPRSGPIQQLTDPKDCRQSAMSASKRKTWVLGLSVIVLSSLLLMSRDASADPVLDVLIGGESRQFRRDELLLRPDVATVEVANDVSYRKTVSYRAVPLVRCLPGSILLRIS